MPVHRPPLAALGLLAAVTGCSEVVPTTARAPSNPADVQVYDKAPARYETLGQVSTPVVGRWDDQANANDGFDRLRHAAAARGANGLLLDSATIHADAEFVAGDRGTFHTVLLRGAPNNRTAVAEAIYVHEK